MQITPHVIDVRHILKGVVSWAYINEFKPHYKKHIEKLVFVLNLMNIV